MTEYYKQLSQLGNMPTSDDNWKLLKNIIEEIMQTIKPSTPQPADKKGKK